MLDRWSSKGWASLLGWLAMLALVMGAAAAQAQGKAKVGASLFNAKDCYECHEAI
jgi:cytochrome c551/c552